MYRSEVAFSKNLENENELDDSLWILITNINNENYESYYLHNTHLKQAQIAATNFSRFALFTRWLSFDIVSEHRDDLIEVLSFILLATIVPNYYKDQNYCSNRDPDCWANNRSRACSIRHARSARINVPSFTWTVTSTRSGRAANSKRPASPIIVDTVIQGRTSNKIICSWVYIVSDTWTSDIWEVIHGECTDWGSTALSQTGWYWTSIIICITANTNVNLKIYHHIYASLRTYPLSKRLIRNYIDNM